MQRERERERRRRLSQSFHVRHRLAQRNQREARHSSYSEELAHGLGEEREKKERLLNTISYYICVYPVLSSYLHIPVLWGRCGHRPVIPAYERLRQGLAILLPQHPNNWDYISVHTTICGVSSLPRSGFFLAMVCF